MVFQSLGAPTGHFGPLPPPTAPPLSADHVSDAICCGVEVGLGLIFNQVTGLKQQIIAQQTALLKTAQRITKTSIPTSPSPAPIPPTVPVHMQAPLPPCAQPPAQTLAPAKAPAKAKPVPPTPTVKPKPSSPPSVPSPPSFAKVAKSLARPSLVVAISADKAHEAPSAVHRTLQDIMVHLNAALGASSYPVTLSTARWTQKNNLVVVAGPNTTAHHLTSASHFISDTLSSFLLASQSPLPLLALSWVRAPSTYGPGSASSLVIAFEDPLGESMCSLIEGQTLYAFGHAGELRRWKQKPRASAAPVPAS
ncbi:hypothetical protein BJY52DRAFT_1227260 [Lactarius psammicola]|nr:hypothetical protein BJY52DRAFT_1227260 [Lactarius psammicola]